MKAAVYQGPQKIELTDLRVPEPGPREVLVKVSGCGVCGTDAHIYNGEISDAVPPVVIGHEITGTVELTGSAITSLKTGDEIVVDPFIYCGICEFCKSGKHRFCENEQFIGYHRNGGFCQYTLVPEANAYALPPGLTFADKIICETLATVLAGLDKIQPRSGDVILLLGAGTVGLLWNQMLRLAGPAAIIQTEIISERRELAVHLGADRAIPPETGLIADAVAKYSRLGADFIVDATGSTEAVEQALPFIKKGGTFLSFGICPAAEKLSLSLNWLYKRQIKILTSRRPPRRGISGAIRLLESKMIDTEPLVTSIRPLHMIEKAFIDFGTKKASEIKMAIDPWG
jgi:L-iditol 2-dehydrogenase